MPGDVEVIIDKADMKRVDNLLKRYPKQIPVAMSRAINKTTDAARVLAVREIAADTKLKKSDIFKKSGGRPIRQTRARRNRLFAEIIVTGKRIPLSRFRARQTRKGVSYDLGRGRTTIKGAFMKEVFGKNPAATSKVPGKGHIGVFRRIGSGRGKMIQLFGPSLLQVFTGTQRIIKHAIEKANKDLPKNINMQIKLMLEKMNK